MTKKIISIFIAVILSVSLVACGEENNEKQVKTEEPIKQEEIKSSSTNDNKVLKTNNSEERSPNEKNTSKNTANEKSNSNNSITSDKTESQGSIVYWTPNGECYHATRNCPTLSRSKTINEGKLSDCPKKRACSKC